MYNLAMPTISQSDELVRESQVLEVMELIRTRKLSVKEACAEVGIEQRTYQRWKPKVSLQAIQTEIDRRKADIAVEVFSAYPARVQKLIEIATGRDLTAKAADILAAGRDLDVLYGGLLQQIETAGKESEDADDYLNQQPDWLKGPETKTVRMKDGTKVDVTVTPPPVVVVDQNTVPQLTGPEGSQSAPAPAEVHAAENPA